MEPTLPADTSRVSMPPFCVSSRSVEHGARKHRCTRAGLVPGLGGEGVDSGVDEDALIGRLGDSQGELARFVTSSLDTPASYLPSIRTLRETTSDADAVLPDGTADLKRPR